jgi:hypothetical protein
LAIFQYRLFIILGEISKHVLDECRTQQVVIRLYGLPFWSWSALVARLVLHVLVVSIVIVIKLTAPKILQFCLQTLKMVSLFYLKPVSNDNMVCVRFVNYEVISLYTNVIFYHTVTNLSEHDLMHWKPLIVFMRLLII